MYYDVCTPAGVLCHVHTNAAAIIDTDEAIDGLQCRKGWCARQLLLAPRADDERAEKERPKERTKEKPLAQNAY
eukprot:scaffold341658_cov39-Prasinocladus_malaysianus.AAC.1